MGRRVSQSSRLYQSSKNREEALENIKEAIQAYIAALEEDNSGVQKDKKTI